MAFPAKLRLWGIGGVGMSALAQHFHRLGHQVTGYDREASPLTDRLQAKGIPIDFSPTPQQAEKAQGIIYTPAIAADFPEWEPVRRLNLPTWRRGQALAQVVADHTVLAVAGAHGKTTTTALLAWLLHALGAQPLAFIGGLARNFDSTYVGGSGPWAVVEADEYDRAMLLLSPAHAIIQSVDPDHLEVYGSPEGVLQAYRQFAGQVRGLCVAPEAVPDLGRPLVRYALEAYQAQGRQVEFVYRWEGRRRTVAWTQIGRHLAENAAAALTLLEALGWDFPGLQEALASFAGVERRMELYELSEEYFVVSDYAHHPTEIRRTLQALRESFPAHRLVVAFQPHLYSRTAFFAKEFAQALSLADSVLLFPIYAARESSTPSVTSKLISQYLEKPVQELLSLTLDMVALSAYLNPKPVGLVFLGAGDVYRLVPETLAYLRDRLI
ncbi:MAG: hypothetical protein D6750_10440 [Bacteroidetes bacterium]|nr:MAG: hypothetical protein D6750_10440 [Bacteroidota bacterium]